MKYPNASPTLTFTEAINRAANNLLNINGRARRSEFWWTKLVTFSLAMIFGFGILLDLLTIPLTVRRLHDTGRSGWWLLGSIILSVIFFGIACYDLVALFIDASNEHIKVTNNNKLTEENIQHILDWFVGREDVDYIAKLVSNDDVAANDYNLSVSTYVEPEDTREVVDIKQLNADIKQIVKREQELREKIDAIVKEIEG